MEANFPILIILVLLSGVFSGSEIALTALGAAKVKSMESDGKFGSVPILHLKNNPQRLLVTVLVANQAVNVAATVVATILGIHLFGEELLGLFTLIFTIILIFFGSLLPKTFALRYPEPFARAVSHPLIIFIHLARPVVWIFEVLTQAMIRLFGAGNINHPLTTTQEIEAMLEISAEEGVLPEVERGLMKHVLKFTDTSVSDVMTLVRDIDSIDIESEREDLEAFMVKHDHSHFPVYEDQSTNIKGILELHDLYSLIKSTQKKYPLKGYNFRPVVVVPHTTSLMELFKELRGKGQRMAVVVDEYGQIVGTATLGDILNEIAGLHIEAKGEHVEDQVVKVDNTHWEVKGDTTISQINKALGISLNLEEHKSISLVVLELLKRFPQEGEKLKIDKIGIEVTALSKKTVDKLLIRKLPASEVKSVRKSQASQPRPEKPTHKS